ncbi:hypothetical protein EYZ11_012459 [Aspergillus tanneri]|uniref:Uncharacterized protein n=1 Tax=Aspergillus tanneri TaxID=1220188 RepID=A0A4V3UMP5_9EURO|nr:hypothetical protein EYZ11_012459 [Aspergillus tanneri]
MYNLLNKIKPLRNTLHNTI